MFNVFWTRLQDKEYYYYQYTKKNRIQIISYDYFLKFDESNECTFHFETFAPTIDGLMVNRPCGGEKFVRCIYEIMRLGNFVLFEPDGKHPIITDPETEKHMHADMIESLGTPIVATNWESFNSVFWNNR